MKWALYNILFALVYPFLLPGFLLRMLRRGGYANRFLDRFALYPSFLHSTLNTQHSTLLSQHPTPNKTKRLATSNFIWLHAVSVGEVQVAGQLMREWRRQDPSVRFCFSTTSSTGWMMAQKELASLNPQPPTPNPQSPTPNAQRSTLNAQRSSDILIYNPLDFPNFVKSALKRIRPRAIILTESEIWPNFIRTAKRYGIPLYLINARVSDRSAPRYKLARYFFKDVLSSFTRIFAQSELDKRRLVDAGAPEGIIDVTGSFKFDVAHRNEAKEKELREWIGPGKIVLGGSTWPGEDEVLLKIYKKLISTVDDLRPLLVLAPRHFEKADHVEANIVKHGFTCIRRSHTSPSTHLSSFLIHNSNFLTSPPVFLCDTTGEMMGLFGICDAAFVGKSLCAHGSQNMIEPCLCGKPTVVGPYTENFRPVMSDLLDANAIVQVPDETALEETILRWFREGDGGLGARAAAAVQNRCGVVSRCVASIRRLMSLLLTLSLFTFHFSLILGCSREAPPSREKPAAICEEVVIASQCICDMLGGATNGLNILKIDARKLDNNQFFKTLARVPDAAALWMPGEFDWLVTWPADGHKHKFADILDRYAAFDNAEALIRAGCDGVPAVFASYAGAVRDIRPAFDALEATDKAMPEFFVTKRLPAFDDFDFTGVEDDVRAKLLEEIRSRQNVRRIILEGCMHSRRNEVEPAIEAWARAAKRYANDIMLIERLEHLKTNGEVFYRLNKPAMAARCYDIMAQIRPNDPVPVFNYGVCVQQLGQADLAERAFARARQLDQHAASAVDAAARHKLGELSVGR